MKIKILKDFTASGKEYKKDAIVELGKEISHEDVGFFHGRGFVSFEKTKRPASAKPASDKK